MLSRSAFTLLEICLAMAIGLLLLSMAIPSVNGFLDQQARQQSFGRFDTLVRQARDRSVEEHRSYAIVWEEGQLLVLPEKGAEEDSEAIRLEINRDEAYELELPAAVVKKPQAVWVFWPTGTCEPARITYKNKKHCWTAVYNPLTVSASLEVSP